MAQIIISNKTKRRIDTRRICFLTFAFTMVATFSFLLASNIHKVSGANLSNFNPGNIISDFTMSNYTTMTEAGIQAFLKSKNHCNDTRLYLAQQYSNYQYHIENGHFVCMADETFDDGHGGKTTAAHLIWQAAQDYRINPQVLIVLLQKEQGLVTDTWPNQRQYKAATGYGCPDTAPCDEKYYGLKNQLDNAAKLFRTVLDGGWTNYPVGWNYVQYNPNPDCGGTWINIENRATSSLYRYTPYQPNASSLAAGYGTGDWCGAYGNRNFYLYFEDWFGGIQNVKQHRKVDPAAPGTKQQTIIDNKEYIIASALDNKYAIDIYGGSLHDGSNIQLYGSHGRDNQKFKFIYNANGFYEIVNPASNKALNVYGGWMDEETNVQLWERDGTCASYWRIDKNEDDTYRIQSACSDLVLDIYGGKTIDGKNIQVYFDHNGKNQHWRLLDKIEEESSNNTDEGILDLEYAIVSASDKDYAIDIYGGIKNAVSGSNIQLYQRHNNDNQKFKFVYNESNGMYEIVNITTNKSLNVYGASKNPETNIQLWDRDGTCASYWHVDKNSDGTYTIRSGCSDLVIDICGGKALSERNIQIYSSHGLNNQKWFLESV